MTQNELIIVINKLKEKRPLSNADILYLGYLCKQLPKSQKSWEEVAEALDLDITGEQLRCQIKYAIQRDHIQPVEEIDNIIYRLESNSDDFKIFETDSAILQRKKQSLKDYSNLYRRYIRDDARVEEFKNLLSEAISKLEPLPKFDYVSKKVNTNSKSEAILMLSDLHIGVDIDNFANKYNYTIAQQRLNKLVDDTIYYCNKFNISQLNVVNLGDLISGIIHITIRLDQEFDVIQQVIKASELLANCLLKLSFSGFKIIYRSCTDNHSRTIANKNEAIEKENFYRIIDWYLSLRLKDTNIIFSNDNLDESLGRFKLLNGQLVMFSHGHLDTKNCVFQNYVGATKEFVDYILLGHYHSFSIKTFQQCQVFINGSIVGADQYATQKRLFSKPTQTLLIFDTDNKNNTNVLSFNIDLQNT